MNQRTLRYQTIKVCLLFCPPTQCLCHTSLGIKRRNHSPSSAIDTNHHHHLDLPLLRGLGVFARTHILSIRMVSSKTTTNLNYTWMKYSLVYPYSCLELQIIVLSCLQQMLNTRTSPNYISVITNNEPRYMCLNNI